MPDILEDFSAAGGADGGGAFNVAIYIIISMTVIVGIAYLISRAMNNRKLEDWSKNEFMQVLISAAIVGALFLLMNPGTGIIITLFNGLVAGSHVTIINGGETVTATGCDAATGIYDSSALCFATNYLTILEGLIFGIIGSLFSLVVIVDLFAKFSIDLIILEISPFAGLSSVVQVINTMLQSLIFLGIIVGVEKALMHFIGMTALNVFLPIGVVLRSFFGTRRIGGALMALAVGLYIVFPLTIALNAISVGQIAQEEVEIIDGFIVELENLSFFNSEHFESTSDFADSESWLAYLGAYKTAMSEEGRFMDMLRLVPQHMINVISALVVQIVFLPVLSIMLTLISIKELANIFGSEVNLSRFEV
ncbi:MAG: hypothetical protein ABII71_05695 [Candidatus Micrarchaeota archaeon]